MNKTLKQGAVGGIVSILLLAAGTCPDASQETSALSLDNLELKLELYRHEKLAAVKQQAQEQLAPFASDGCSGGLSIGWNFLADHIDQVQEIHGDLPPWESCCISHDRAYHTAGPKTSGAEDSFAARRAADEQLRQCVLETGIERAPELSAEYGISVEETQRIYTVIGALMYRAVRLGGVPCSGLPWRWGYGWPECQ